MKNVLLVVTGKTPQIITETVYGLAVTADEPWVPDEVYVISTKEGLTQIRATLLEDRVFNSLCEDYQLSDIHFDESCLHSIKDADGNELDDLKTPEDNQCAADMICSKIQEITSDDTCLHVSIAGGRKTMGFYAGYALSLYGRYQDSMSHVLVEDKFENASGFYYPAKQPKKVFATKYIDGKPERLDAYEATIWLANIPFVRLRNSIDKSLLSQEKSFVDIINTINIAMMPIQLEIIVKSKTLVINGVSCKLEPKLFAYYLWFAKNFCADQLGFELPVEGERKTVIGFFELYKGKENLVPESDEKEFKKYVLDKANCEQYASKLNRKFKEVFGVDIAEKLAIIPKQGAVNQRVLALKSEQIVIIDN